VILKKRQRVLKRLYQPLCSFWPSRSTLNKETKKAPFLKRHEGEKKAIFWYLTPLPPVGALWALWALEEGSVRSMVCYLSYAQKG